MNQSRRRVLSLGLAGGILLGSFSSSLAYGAEELYTAVDGYQISVDALEDGVIEYRELGSLIHYGNLSIQSMTDSVERQRAEYQEIYEFLKVERSSAAMKSEEAEEDGDIEAYAEYAMYESVYQSAVKSYRKMLEKLDRYSSNKSRIQLERQLTKAAQSLMISYESLKGQQEFLAKNEELSRASYENLLASENAGMATTLDVEEAYQSWLNAQISLNTVASSVEMLKNQLCSMLGQSEVDLATLQEIPSVEPERIQQMDLEADTQKAVNNNINISQQRSISSDGSTSGVKHKLLKLDSLEKDVRIQMEELYEQVHQAQTGYEATLAAYEGASVTWNTAVKQYELGMLNRVQYLQEEMMFQQKKAEKKAADLELLLAVETYEWAKKGII